EGALEREQARPVHLARRLVKILLAGIVEPGDAPEDARGEARPEVRRVADLPVARERGAAGHLPHALRAKRRELRGEQRFQAAWRRGEKLFHRRQRPGSYCGLKTTSRTTPTRMRTGNSLNQRNHTCPCVLRSRRKSSISLPHQK